MLRMEIACILILLFIAALYFTASREKSQMHKVFSAILITLMIHLVFDAITVVTVAQLDTFPRFWNDTFHKIFLATMLLTIYLYYSYINLLVAHETGEKSRTNLNIGVGRFFEMYLVAAEIALFVVPVTYEVTPKGNYASGISALIIYVSIALFLLHMVWNVVFHWKSIHPKKRIAIVAAFLIEIIVTTLTFIDTSLLLAGMGLTLIAVSFYLVLENPDIKLLELAREEKRKADDANASKSAFLSVVSHEIRTPMNAIVGMSELLMEEDLSPQAIDYLQSIKTSGDSLLMIVNELLDQSKIEAGKMEIIEDAYEWDSLLREISMIIQNRVGNKDIKVQTHLDERLPAYIVGDRLRIRQILINLMNNAVKFTNSGSITLSIEMQNEDENGYQIRYGVKDTGQGIRKEDLDVLFEAFSQVDQKKNHNKEGTGLGLTISRDFVKLMGGELSVSSEYGQGSEFFFTIYQKRAEQSETKKNKPKQINYESHMFDASKAKILIVDDAAINLMVLKKLLQPTNILVDAASSGAEAISFMEVSKYDLVFMDYNMPEMNGIDTTIQIRQMSSGKEVPIIALTGDTFEESKAAFKEAGMNGYLEKPVSKILLYDMLVNWLPEGKISWQ